MKKSLLLLFCLTLFSGVFAQSFSLIDSSGVAIDPGSTIQFIGDPSLETIYSGFFVINYGETDKSVAVKKVIHEGDTVTGSKNTFCWGLCYPDTTFVSPYPQYIMAGDTNRNFTGDYNPNGLAGVSRIMYVFYDVDNRDDSVAIVVEYVASPASVNDYLLKQVKFSDAYPNPAINYVNVDYKMPESVQKASIAITNILGSRVKEINLPDRTGKVRIPVNEFKNGIYFYSLIADDNLVVTRKFTVKH